MGKSVETRVEPTMKKDAALPKTVPVSRDDVIVVEIDERLVHDSESRSASAMKLGVELDVVLARAGWRFSGAEFDVYREVDRDEDSAPPPDCDVICQDKITRELVRFEWDKVKDDATCNAVFAKFYVFVACSFLGRQERVNATTSRVVLKKRGFTGVPRLMARGQLDALFHRFDAPLTKTTVANVLAKHMTLFADKRVFVETRSNEQLFFGPSDADDVGCINCSSTATAVDQNEVVVVRIATSEIYCGDDAKLLVGPIASANSMHALGFAVFRIATSPDHVVRANAAVLVAKHTSIGDEIDDDVVDEDNERAPKRIDDVSGRFEFCAHEGTTVGLALRRNDVHYAALHGVFVRWMTGAIPANRTLYAVAVDRKGRDERVVWTGSALAQLAQFPAFRAKFELYVQCESTHQVLRHGERLMLDLHTIHELPSPGHTFPIALLRLHASPKYDPKLMIRDLGYSDNDEKVTGGFCKGWFRDGHYWRFVGDKHVDARLSGGTVGKPFDKNIRPSDDFGYAHTRILVELPGHGVCYCRGVGEESNNPVMACVLFDEPPANRDIADKFAFRKLIGRWDDIVQ